MSKKGENIFKRKDGRWEARYEKGRRPDGSIVYGFCYGRSYREAREKVNLLRVETLNGNNAVVNQSHLRNIEPLCSFIIST